MTMFKPLLASAALALLFAGCGDNGNRTIYYPVDNYKTGRFIDAGVEGLRYEGSSGKNGLTKKGGAFTYRFSDTITFYIGNLRIGSTLAVSTLTPKEIAAFETGDPFVSLHDNAVINRVRLLLSLDANTTAGIQIGPDTQAKAEHWDTPDYNLSIAAFTDDVRRATKGDVTALVSRQRAITHFENALRCIYSGGYRGQWHLPDGQRSGFVGVLIQSDGGIVAMGDGQQIGENNNTVIYAAGEHDMDSGTYTFVNSTYYFDPEKGQIIPGPPTDISGEGKSVGYDKVEGNFTQNGQTGIYTAYRVGRGSDTAYRYTGFGFQNDDSLIGIFTLDMNRNGHVVGMIHDARSDAQPEITGTVDYESGDVNLSIANASNTQLFGRIDFQHFDGNLSLSWKDRNGTGLGYARGVGCQLQAP